MSSYNPDDPRYSHLPTYNDSQKAAEQYLRVYKRQLRENMYWPSGLDDKAIAHCGVPAHAFADIGYPNSTHNILDENYKTLRVQAKAVLTTLFVEVVKPVYVYKIAQRVNRVRNVRNTKYALVTLILLPGSVVRMWSQHGARREFQKCRTNAAYVHRIQSIQYDGNSTRYVVSHSNLPRAVSGHRNNFKYTPGDIVVPAYGFDYSAAECASGIHFFFDRDQAINYDLS